MKYEKKKNITFAEITPEWVQGFKDYLEKDAVAWGHDFRTRIKDKPLAKKLKGIILRKVARLSEQGIRR